MIHDFNQLGVHILGPDETAVSDPAPLEEGPVAGEDHALLLLGPAGDALVVPCPVIGRVQAQSAQQGNQSGHVLVHQEGEAGQGGAQERRFGDVHRICRGEAGGQEGRFHVGRQLKREVLLSPVATDFKDLGVRNSNRFDDILY